MIPLLLLPLFHLARAGQYSSGPAHSRVYEPSPSLAGAYGGGGSSGSSGSFGRPSSFQPDSGRGGPAGPSSFGPSSSQTGYEGNKGSSGAGSFQPPQPSPAGYDGGKGSQGSGSANGPGGCPAPDPCDSEWARSCQTTSQDCRAAPGSPFLELCRQCGLCLRGGGPGRPRGPPSVGPTQPPPTRPPAPEETTDLFYYDTTLGPRRPDDYYVDPTPPPRNRPGPGPAAQPRPGPSSGDGYGSDGPPPPPPGYDHSASQPSQNFRPSEPFRPSGPSQPPYLLREQALSRDAEVLSANDELLASAWESQQLSGAGLDAGQLPPPEPRFPQATVFRPKERRQSPVKQLRPKAQASAASQEDFRSKTLASEDDFLSKPETLEASPERSPLLPRTAEVPKKPSSFRASRRRGPLVPNPDSLAAVSHKAVRKASRRRLRLRQGARDSGSRSGRDQNTSARTGADRSGSSKTRSEGSGSGGVRRPRCVDKDSLCQYWAFHGHCEGSAWMAKSCPKSCKACPRARLRARPRP